MSYLWMCLSLLYAASFLQGGASSGQVVSLRCNQTVEVAAKETAIINCSILSMDENCMGDSYFWSNTFGRIECGSEKYKCEWDYLTYVLLAISNVTKAENYTIGIMMDCDMAESFIKVRIKPPSAHGPGMSEWDPKTTVILAVLSFFAALFVSGILYFLFRTHTCRKMIKSIRKEKTHGNPCDMDAAEEGKTLNAQQI